MDYNSAGAGGTFPTGSAMPKFRTADPGKRPTLGFQINNLQARYSFLLWPGVADAAAENDVNLFIFSGETIDSPYGYEYQHNVIYDFISSNKIDGLIMATGTLFNYIEDQKVKSYYGRFQPMPMVNISIQIPGIPSVLVDNKAGMRDAVLHLIEHHGLKRIAFIQGPEGNQEAIERFQAYQEALHKHGIAPDPRLTVAGDFSPFAGIEAVRQLIDRRNANFDAIVAANDDMALGVLEELARRKIRVPQDVVVTGFDNIPEVQFNSTPLTTVRQPLYEQAKKATEMAVAMVRGEEVPERVVLPTKLVTRTSCGCLSQSILMLERDSRNTVPIGGATAGRETTQSLNEKIFAEIRDFVRDTESERKRFSIWIKEFLDIFTAQTVDESVSHTFLKRLNEILDDQIKRGNSVSPWQNVLTIIHNHVLSGLDNANTLRAEALFQEARVLIGEEMQLQQVLYIVQREKSIVSLIDFTHKLISTLYVDELMNAVAKDLPALGIPCCYVALYPSETTRHREDSDWKLPETSELIMAYNENGRIPIGAEEREFPTHDILPEGYLPSGRRFTMVLKPLFFREDQFGFMVFELSGRDAIIYETLRVQISSALKGSLLFRKQQKAEENLLATNEKLQETNEKLKELDQTKTNFFANVSHELRTPLTLILGPIESILSGDFGENLHYRDEIFKSMRVSSARLLKLINNLLDFSRLEAGKMPVNRRRVNISDMLRFYIDTVKPSAASRGLAITFRDNTDETTAFIDRDLAEKAVFNLISNALKFTPSGGKISVELDRDRDTFQITVKDTGIGIPADKLEKIFERFTQLDSSSSKRYEGTGIGLAFTKEIVDLHGGSIRVNSKVGKGTTFVMTIPLGKEGDNLSAQIEDIRDVKSYLLADMMKEKDPGSSSRDKGPRRARTVLVVEDNSDMRKFLQSILERDYNVVTAEHGRAALDVILSQPVDLIVADVMMPEMDGYELTQRVKNNKILKNIPVILVTAKADVSMKIEGLEHRADDYLSKPFNSRELLARISNLMENRSLQLELSRKQKEIDKDFEQAALVQRTILTPRAVYGRLSGLEIDARFIPMNGKISGDYFNISALSDGLASVMIADVAGHGIQAALSTMQIDVLSKETVQLTVPSKRLEYMNLLLTKSLFSKNFFTCFLINIYGGEIHYSSAAHPPQYLVRPSTMEVIPLKTRGKIIGMLEDCSYEEKRERIGKGDILLLFTDGVYEEFDIKEKEFGEERFQDLIREELAAGMANRSVEDINSSILKRLEDFRQGKGLDDDVTLIGIRIR